MSQTAAAPGTARPLGVVSASFALFITALWGGNAVATSFTLDALPQPLAVAAIRFALAALFMVAWCWVEGAGVLLRKEQVGPAFILGFLLFVQIALFNYGVLLSNSSHGVLLVNTVPFWVAAIDHFITRTDRLTGAKLIGLMIASVGVVLVLSTAEQSRHTNPDDPSLIGDLVLVVSAAVLGVKVVYTHHAVKSLEPGKLILWHNLFGVFFFVLGSAALERVELGRLDTPAILAFLYNGLIVGGACYAGQAWLLQKHSASQVAVFNFAAPLFGVILAGLMRRDPLSPWLIVSALCVALGIVLVNRRRSSP